MSEAGRQMFTVVTRVAKPETGGNLAAAIFGLYIEVEKGNAENGWLGRFEPVIRRLGDVSFDLRIPVFAVGEVLVLDSNDRDQFGRKPDKWDVSTESFPTAEAAFERARAVVEAELIGGPRP